MHIYFKLIFLSLIVLLMVFLLESIAKILNIPAGCFVGILEVCFSFSASFLCLKRIFHQPIRKHKECFSLLCFAFLLLGVADFYYILNFYLLKTSNKTILSLIFSNFFYSVSYILFTLSMFLMSKKRLVKILFNKSALLASLLTMPVLTKHLIPTIINAISSSGLDLYIFARIFNTLSSMLLIIISFSLLMVAKSKFWTFLSIGTTMIITVNWSLGTEIFMGKEIAFGFYEYLWVYAVQLIAFAVILFHQEMGPSFEERSSLTSQSRFFLFSIVATLILALALSSSFSINSVRIMALGLCFGVISAVLFSELLIDKINHFSIKMGEIIGEGHKGQITEDKLEQLPIELELNYKNIFSKKLEFERDKNIRFESIAKTTQMLAHDVRKPFSMISAVLSILQVDSSPEFIENELPNMLDGVQRAMTSVNGMIRDVMEIGSEGAITASPTSQASLIEMSLSEIVRIYPNSDVQFEYDLAENLSVQVDSIKIIRVYSNIIGNAFEAIKQKGRYLV